MGEDTQRDGAAPGSARQVGVGGAGDRRGWRADLAWAAGLIVFRGLLLVALGVASSWRDPSDDIGFQRAFVQHPLALLLGREGIDPSVLLPPFPPLFPLLLWPVASLLLAALPAMVAMRLTFILFEAGALLATRRALRALGQDAGRVSRASLVWLMAPMAFMSTSIMCQEEAIATFGVALVCLLVAQRRPRAAILACGIGVVAAKVYFLVPLAGLLLCGPWRPREAAVRGARLRAACPRRACDSAGAAGALAGFTPSAAPSINAWGLLGFVDGVDFRVVKYISAVPALLFGLLPAIVARWAMMCAGARELTAQTQLAVIGCHADCDGSGALDLFDFLCFQNAFVGKEQYADCDRSGVLDLMDFLCYQNEFAAGCP